MIKAIVVDDKNKRFEETNFVADLIFNTTEDSLSYNFLILEGFFS